MEVCSKWMPLLADVGYALIYPAVDTFLGIASCYFGFSSKCYADGTCIRGRTCDEGLFGSCALEGDVVPVGWDPIDCGPQASFMSMYMLAVQFWLLPKHWGELTALKLVAVVAGCFVISWLTAKQTTRLVEVGIPIATLYLAWKATDSLAKCWSCLGMCPGGNYNRCSNIILVINLINVLVFAGGIWIILDSFKNALLIFISLDYTVLWPIMLAIVLRNPPDDDNCCYRWCSGCCFCCAGAAVTAVDSINKATKGPGKVLEPILSSDALRSDEELTA